MQGVKGSEKQATQAPRIIAGLSLLVVLLTGTTLLPWQRSTVIATAAAPVRVARATVGELKATVNLNGELRATDQLDVTPRVSSRVTRLPAPVGKVVQAGEVLAELDRTLLEIELTRAQTALDKERANLAKVDAAAPAEEIVKLEAAIRSAEAALAEVLAGAKPEDVDIAAQKVSQARTNRFKTASQLGNAKEQARIAWESSAESLRAAQAQYGASKLVYDEAVRTGKDPNIQPQKDNRSANDLSDIKLRQYKADFESKEIAMRVAEQNVEARRWAYEDAKRQEVAGLQVADSQVQDAQASMDKVQSGPTPDEVAAAEADLEEARSDLAAAQAPAKEPDMQIARANLKNAEAAVRLAEINLRETQVVAPFAGIVAQRMVSVGSVVSSGTPIVRLVSQTIEVRLNADDSQVTQLEPGQQADIRLTAYPDTVFPARVESISPTSDTTSRTFTVTLAPEAVDSRLKPGMLAQADVAAVSRPGVLMVPDQAVLARGSESSVFVVVDGKAQRKIVGLGIRGNGMVEVLNGLKEGDSVVIEGQAALKENEEVTVSG
jgi:HlyD family secretion protein